MAKNAIIKAKLLSDTKVRTGKVRLGFANINPKGEDGKIDKTNITAIIDKDDDETLSLIDSAIEAAIEVGKEKFGKQFDNRKRIHTPLHDGDEEKDGNEAYVDKMYINASSKDPIGMVGPDKVKISDPGEFYSGAYVSVALNFAPYVYNGPGIGCYIANIMKLEDGERIGFTRASAYDDFSDDDDDDSDFLAD